MVCRTVCSPVPTVCTTVCRFCLAGAHGPWKKLTDRCTDRRDWATDRPTDREDFLSKILQTVENVRRVIYEHPFNMKSTVCKFRFTGPHGLEDGLYNGL